MARNILAQKINSSSIQVIKTLKVLLQGDYTMHELIDILNENEPEPVFNNSVISKYINTCRFCGFEIHKIYNKYYVSKIPFGLELSDIDVDIIKALCTYVQDEMSSRNAVLITSFFDKVRRFSNREIEAVNKDKLDLSIELFERAVAKQRKVKLLFKNRDIIECIPLDVTKTADKTYYNVLYKKPRSIDSSRLAGIQMTGQRYAEPFASEQTVVFKLTGGLAKRYEPRANESVEVTSDGDLIVTNKYERKELLFSRLLRYDEKCEIIRPVAYREEMKELIKEMLQNYGVS